MSLFDDQPEATTPPAEERPALRDPTPAERAGLVRWLKNWLTGIARFRAEDLGREAGYATEADAHKLLDSRRGLRGIDRGFLAEVFEKGPRFRGEAS